MKIDNDATFLQLSEICLALPEAVRAIHGDSAWISKKSRIFAILL